MTALDRRGNEVATYDAQNGVLTFLYSTAVGRCLLWPLVRPWVSKTAGWFLDRRVSVPFIRPFVQKNGIDLREYEPTEYHSYNQFFCRRIRPALRPVDAEESHLIAPCDAKVTVCPIGEDATFRIKGVDYTFDRLVRSETLEREFCGGTLVIFRLTVDDYHRYCYPCSGTQEPTVRLPGVYHTVNPIAAAARPIYRENTREYSVIESPVFGKVLMMEVGAMMVGRIVNDHPQGEVSRGEEKGHFEFGGSTVILCLQRDRVQIDADLFANSGDGKETVVKMGEKIGAATVSEASRRESLVGVV